MDNVGKEVMSAFRLDLRSLKEPLGIIRILEGVFAVFAFAACSGYSGSTNFIIKCQGTGPIHVIHVYFEYPFRLRKQEYNVTNCKNNSSERYQLLGDYSSSAQFFVAVGVLAFLYSTAMLVLYLGYRHVYRESRHGPTADLLITGMFAFLWLVASSAWGKGLTDVKWATSPTGIISIIKPCKDRGNNCTPGAIPAFGPLNSSVISGFLELILWGGNCWFIFKETQFHKSLGPSATQPATQPQPIQP